MFTGIVKSIGRIASRESHGADVRIRIHAGTLHPGNWDTGASIAVNGVCLTAVELDSDGFAADVSPETLKVTTLGELTPGSAVNLEPALRLGEPLDGHWVTGHVDGIARITDIADIAGAGRSQRLRIAAAGHLGRYLAYKGSVAVDGVSLTINAVDADGAFEVTIIPHTRSATIIRDYAPGTAVNIEVDIVARYLERLVPAAQ